MVLKLIYEDYSQINIAILLLGLSPYIVGVIEKRNYYSILLVMILNSICFILIGLMYKKAKEKKNLSLILNIGIYNQISIGFSLTVYYLIFNTISLITFDEESTEPTGTMVDLAIVGNVFYSLIAILLITYYKDVVFSMILLIIEIGYMINIYSYPHFNEQTLLGEKITSISVLVIITLSVITSFFKHGKVVLGYEQDEDIENLLEKFRQRSMHKKSDLSN